jgi:hypothetical protein
MQEMVRMHGQIPGTSWTVIGPEPQWKITRDKKGITHRRAMWLCRCNGSPERPCGVQKLIDGRSLRSRSWTGELKSQSCGCLRRRVVVENFQRYRGRMQGVQLKDPKTGRWIRVAKVAA